MPPVKALKQPLNNNISAVKSPDKAEPTAIEEETPTPGFSGRPKMGSNLNSASILNLQRTIGNQAVMRLIQQTGEIPRPSVPSPAPIQRFIGQYTTKVGESWVAVAAENGISLPTEEGGLFSQFLALNNATWQQRSNMIKKGRVVKIPDGVRAKSGVAGQVPHEKSGSPPTVPAQAQLGTMLTYIGSFLDWSVPKAGDKYAYEFSFAVPVWSGISVGLKLVGEASREDGQEVKVKSQLMVEGKGQVKIPYIGEINLAGALGGTIEAASKTGATGAMEAVSFGYYRKAQENNYFPMSVAQYIWGADAANWSQKAAARMVSEDSSVMLGGAAEIKGEAEGDKQTFGEDGGKMGVKGAYVRGTEYNKDSILGQGVQTKDGYRGAYASYINSTEKSLGKTKNAFELEIEGEAFGYTGGYKHSIENGQHKGELKVKIKLETLQKLLGGLARKAQNKKLLELIQPYLKKADAAITPMLRKVAALSESAGKKFKKAATLYSPIFLDKILETLSSASQSEIGGMLEFVFEMEFPSFTRPTPNGLTINLVGSGGAEYENTKFESDILAVKGERSKRLGKWG